MLKEYTLGLMEDFIQEIGRMEKNMVKEHTFHLMVKSMKGNGRMGNIMVKEPRLILVDGSG